MEFAKPQFFFNAGNATTINNGTLRLNGGADNTLPVFPTATTPAINIVQVNGGTLDLYGRNQAVATLSSVNALAGTGGIITNGVAATNVTLTAATLATATFSGRDSRRARDHELHPVGQLHHHPDREQHLHRCHHHPRRHAVSS